MSDKIVKARVDMEILRMSKIRNTLESLPRGHRVLCMVCGGAADPQCGCDGTQTTSEAIAYLDSNMETLSK